MQLVPGHHRFFCLETHRDHCTIQSTPHMGVRKNQRPPGAIDFIRVHPLFKVATLTARRQPDLSEAFLPSSPRHAVYSSTSICALRTFTQQTHHRLSVSDDAPPPDTYCNTRRLSLFTTQLRAPGQSPSCRESRIPLVRCVWSNRTEG